MGNTPSRSEGSSDFVPLCLEGSFSKHVYGAEMVVLAQRHPAPEQWGWGPRRVDRSGLVRGSPRISAELQRGRSGRAWLPAWPSSPNLLSQTAHSSGHRMVLMGCKRNIGSFPHPAPPSFCSTSQDSRAFSILPGLAMRRRRVQDC